MEQVLFRLHVRFSRAFCYVFSPISRRYLEALSLFNACLCLTVLVMLHTTYLRPHDTNNCIHQALYDQGKGGINLEFDVLEISFVSNKLPNYLCLFEDDRSVNMENTINKHDDSDVNTWSWIKNHVCISKTPDKNMAKEFWFSLDKGKIYVLLHLYNLMSM